MAEMSKDEAQGVVDGLESAAWYVPDELMPSIKRAINDLVERYDVICDDTELTVNAPERDAET